MIECRIIDSMNKVFMDAPPKGKPLSKGSVLLGETFSFQIAYKANRKITQLKIEVDSELEKLIRVRRITNIAVENISVPPPRSDAEHLSYERLTPGLYPDVLSDDLELLHASQEVWHSIWVDVTVPARYKAGKYPIRFTISNGMKKDSEQYIESKTGDIELEIIDAKLPPQKLIHTEWFYTDCLCNSYHVEPWTEKHWELIGAYLKTFTAHGINMLLTPIFTPPLDTAIGGERLTTQLVKIKATGKDQYSFDFKLLDRWIDLAQKEGVKYFEFSHLFTQWGAGFCPKIVAEVNGEEKKISGWETKATGAKYRKFLDSFLPALKKFILKKKIASVSYFHISDEPTTANIENYAAAYRMAAKHLDSFKIIDALSHPEFYTEGYVKLPIPRENELDRFMSLDISERWTYYCGGHGFPCSNRLHHMSAYTNRIMGLLLYVYDLDGFLHWGFNFWNSLLSKRACDPLRTETDWNYPPGDAALVYPGKDGPLDSMRLEVFHHGLQDLRALRLLESLIGRPAVLRFIEKEAGMKITMQDFPRSMEWLSDFRLKTNRKIKQHAKN